MENLNQKMQWYPINNHSILIKCIEYLKFTKNGQNYALELFICSLLWQNMTQKKTFLKSRVLNRVLLMEYNDSITKLCYDGEEVHNSDGL